MSNKDGKLVVGDKAPDFQLSGHDGKMHRLSDYLGEKGMILFFYPKDNTPGCTTESCEFKEIYDEIRQTGHEILGISRDGVTTHNRFREKYELPFTLLSDEDKSIHQAYGVWKEKNMYGKKTMGVVRSTFVISKEGIIKEVFYNVRAKGHAFKVREYLLNENV
jgi:peroxiredoxin Q/BCP